MAKKRRAWPELGQPLPAPVMDNHTHLPLHEGEIPSADGYRMPLETQIAHAQQMRVTRMITVGAALPDLKPTVELAREWPEVKAALAIHPNEAALHAGHLDRSPDGFEHEKRDYHVPLLVALERVSALLDDPEVVAVGETGLDFYRTAEPGQEAQREAFQAHLEMGRSHGLPVQIHDRDAHAATLEVLDDSAWDGMEIVFHSFSGDREMASKLAEKGWFASFSGMVTFPANDELRAALLQMPRDLVLVETDAPYLTPAPYRGMPNASYVMPYTVRKIAELWEEDVAHTANLLMGNSQRLYGTW